MSEIKFASTPSQGDKCLCDGCHELGRVLKIHLPETMFHDGINLTTRYRDYWVCRECQTKLACAVGKEIDNE